MTNAVAIGAVRVHVESAVREALRERIAQAGGEENHTVPETFNQSVNSFWPMPDTCGDSSRQSFRSSKCTLRILIDPKEPDLFPQEPRSQRRGQGFESLLFHQFLSGHYGRTPCSGGQLSFKAHSG